MSDSKKNEAERTAEWTTGFNWLEDLADEEYNLPDPMVRAVGEVVLERDAFRIRAKDWEEAQKCCLERGIKQQRKIKRLEAKNRQSREVVQTLNELVDAKTERIRLLEAAYDKECGDG